MRDMMWIYAAGILLLSEVWSNDQGLYQNFTSVNANTSYPKVVRHLTVNLGSDVNLTCSSKTWNETIFVTWTLTLKNKKCNIAFIAEGRSDDYCNDSKSLQNTSSGQSYLHIPKFSNDDVGDYRCESFYRGGSDDYMIHVGITVPPTTSIWLEHTDNKMVAVCRAAGGKPAANISWSHAGNLQNLTVESNSHGFLTVESRLELPEGMDTENLSCAISHQYWKEEVILKLPRAVYVPWLSILVVVGVIMFLAGFLFFAQKKLISRRCKKSVTSPSKAPPTEDVEEVEPYASYVQRVNSIYNSSADLFTSNPAHASHAHT